MSFKREGDDQCQLNLLKKRRVSDLLAEDIPEDEAFLMSSGRYSCTVCHHRPVFDTIAMLLVHRKGKRHLGSVQSYYAKKQDFMREVEKRKQLLHLKNLEGGKPTDSKFEDVVPLITRTRQATHHALLKAAPYKGYKTLHAKQEENGTSFCSTTATTNRDSFFQRVSKNSHHSSDDLQDEGSTQSYDTSSRNVNTSSEMQTKDFALLSCERKVTDEASRNRHPDVSSLAWHPGDIGNNLNQPSSKNLSSVAIPLTVLEKRHHTPDPIKLKPYVPKRLRHRGLADLKTEQSCSEKAPSPIQDHFEGIGNKLNQSYPTNTQSAEIPLTVLEKQQPVSVKLKPYVPKHLGNKYLTDSSIKESGPAQASSPEQGHLKTKSSPRAVRVEQTLLVPRIKSVRLKQNPEKSEDNAKKSCTVDVDSKKSEKERYLKLTSSGWKTDWRGGWIQDPDVEFDSDEEIPS